MNRNEFYKELMKEYTFDSAKVRRVAKRSSSRVVSTRRGWHLPATAAVVAASLLIGLFTVLYNGNSSMPTITDTLTVQERVIRAELTQLSSGPATMFLSFNNSLTFDEMQNAFDSISDTDIEVKAVYVLEDDSSVTSLALPEKLDVVRDTDSCKIIGAKVSAPSEYRKTLKSQQEVALVEIETENVNDNTFVPLGAIAGAVEEAANYLDELRVPVITEPQPEFCETCEGELPCECEIACDCGECDECTLICDCGECDECTPACDCGECDECAAVECDCDDGLCDDCVDGTIE